MVKLSPSASVSSGNTFDSPHYNSADFEKYRIIFSCLIFSDFRLVSSWLVLCNIVQKPLVTSRGFCNSPHPDFRTFLFFSVSSSFATHISRKLSKRHGYETSRHDSLRCNNNKSHSFENYLSGRDRQLMCCGLVLQNPSTVLDGNSYKNLNIQCDYWPKSQ